MSKAELSSLMATMEELAQRVAALAETSRGAGDEEAAIDLYEVERSLRTAVRRMAKLTDEGRTGGA